MRFMLVSLLFSLSLAATAGVMETRVVDIDLDAERVMVMAETEGRVLWVDATDTAMIRAFETAVESERFIRVNYDSETGNVQGAELMNKVKRNAVPAARSTNKDIDQYNPTVFNSVQQAQSYFNTMDNATKDDSQCYNRAHGWATIWTQYRINSLKIFIFFTRRYIREFDNKWWFHVSPMTLVGDRGYNTEYVMDRSFTRGPVDVKTWTDIFMKNKANCLHVRYYSEYSRNPEAQYCYLMKTIQYYSTPRDLEYLESRGRYETDWVYSELKEGRKRAFINWQRYDP